MQINFNAQSIVYKIIIFCNVQPPKLLRILNLKNCVSLQKLPSNIGSPTRLQIINLEGCVEDVKFAKFH